MEIIIAKRRYGRSNDKGNADCKFQKGNMHKPYAWFPLWQFSVSNATLIARLRFSSL
jgi:hypothetical protein